MSSSTSDRLRKIAPVTTIAPIPFKSEKWIRKDRKNTELRPLCVVTQASGSAYLELQNTKVICGVYGPRQTNEFSDKGKLQCEFKYSTFACKKERKNYVQDKEEREISMLIVQALEVSLMLEKLPKSVIDIYIIVLESDGGILNSCITCASLALADAGIEMFDLVPSVSIGINNNVILLDCVEQEEDNNECTITVAFMPSFNEITQLFEFGHVDYDLLQQATDLCIDSCAKIYQIMKKALQPRQHTHINKLNQF